MQRCDCVLNNNYKLCKPVCQKDNAAEMHNKIYIKLYQNAFVCFNKIPSNIYTIHNNKPLTHSKEQCRNSRRIFLQKTQNPLKLIQIHQDKLIYIITVQNMLS